MRFIDPKKAIRELGLLPGQRVADFGAGSGHYAFAAAEIVGEGGVVYALDIQRDLVSRVARDAAERRLTMIETISCDLEEEEGSHLSKGSFDAVVISNTLFQTENRKALLEEAHRILRKGGSAMVIDWKDSFKGIGPPKEAIVPLREVREWANELGFSEEKTFDPGAHHYGVIFKKS